MNLLLSLPVHVIFCGKGRRIDYGEDEGTGRAGKRLGYRLRAEGETGYESPMSSSASRATKRNRSEAPATILAHVEKDRTGVLAGASIEWPGFDTIAKPLLGLLGSTQAPVPRDDEVAMQ